MPASASASRNEAQSPASEGRCEKSCQVTSEQIKADMKAASENSRRTSSKGVNTDSGGTSTRPGQDSARHSTGVNGAAERPVTEGVGKIEPGAAPGCQRVDRASGRANGSTENHSGTHTVDREGGLRQTSGTARGAHLESRGSDENTTSGQPAGQRHRQTPVAQRSSCKRTLASDENSSLPRRPLTRSCTRMSSVTLMPETGNDTNN